MRKTILNLLTVVAAMALSSTLSAQSPSAYDYDVVIVGGTPGGIMTAISSAREGHSAVILERTTHIGGLPANGLGATDIGTRGVTAGLFLEFVNRNKAYYVETYGPDSQQVKDCSDGYHFEPSVAEKTFLGMIAEMGDKVTVLYNRQFDSNPSNVKMNGLGISAITVTDRVSGAKETYTGKIFIDATYEGDLGAAAGVPYRLGREGRDEFGEVCAGKVYRQWGAQSGNCDLAEYNGFTGYDADGTTYQADNAVQAYNYRLCLTQDKAHMRQVDKPANYDRNEYASIVEDVWTGRHTGTEMNSVTAEDMERNREVLKAGGRTQIPGDRWGIGKVTNMVVLPNGKTDANNQHMAFLSTDLPEENWAWPTASWEWRDKFAQRLKEYTLGLLWFSQNDKELPASFRKECQTWGFSTTEYVDNDNFPRQVYVREGRRFEGQYFFTANDAIPVLPGQRPPLHSSSIASSHYALDSHAVLKRESGRVHLDGFFSHPSAPYTLPLGVIVPKEVSNLLFPVPVSGSHVGFSTMRMEPCWMALGEAAGVAASQAIEEGVSVQGLDCGAIQDKLIDAKASLIYFRDVAPASPDFKMVQKMGLRGFLTGWTADLDADVTKAERADWKMRSGVSVPENLKTRREVLDFILKQIEK